MLFISCRLIMFIIVFALPSNILFIFLSITTIILIKYLQKLQ